MAYVRKAPRSMFENVKSDIEKAYMYFKKNYKRFYDYHTFIFNTSLSPADKSVLNELQKPEMEFNVLEAYISRLCGEFAKMDPAFSVRAKDGVNLMDPRIIEVVEAHLKATFTGASQNSLKYHLYKDSLSGGFSVAKIFTDYANEKSFDQNIYVERVFDPTLTGFDPLARLPHKGDGRFCFELFPKTAGEAEEMYGSDILKGAQFTRNSSLDSFNWSYKNQKEDILLFGEYFRKKLKKTKILKLANGHTVTEKDYENFLAKWNEAGILEVPPRVLKSRMTEIETIDKYVLTGTKMVEHDETNFSMLPLVFFDGNSVIIRDNDQGQSYQMTRPYVFHAKDSQKMKNFAGQSLCNEIENLVQHKWTAPVEGIPDNADYQLAYTNPQKASILLYNQFKDNDPNQQLNPPREIQRPPIPAEIINTFNVADQTIQGVLGSYDAAIGVNENDISGVAIMQGAMHSNAAAMPYTIGFIEGWNRCGEIYLDLLPKYIVTPRSIPVMLPEGKREFYPINQGDNVKFDYDASALQVEVEAGVNFAVQKQIALKTIISLMQASESFAAFMNQEGLEVLLDNIDIRGIDNLKFLAAQFMEKQKEAQAQAAQQQEGQPTPAEMEEQKIQLEGAKIAQKQEEAQIRAQTELATEQMRSATESKEADIKFLEVMSKIQNADLDMALQQEKVDAEQARTAVNMAIDVSKHMNENSKDKDKDDER